MARRAGTESRFAWSTLFYLLLVLVAPLVLLGTGANAQEASQAPIKDSGVTGPGKRFPRTPGQSVHGLAERS